MKYRINEICKEKGLFLKDLATKMGRTPESLSRSLNNGTTTKMLQEIADALGVQIVELFEGYENKEHHSGKIIGVIRYEDNTYEINSIEDIEKLLQAIKNEAN